MLRRVTAILLIVIGTLSYTYFCGAAHRIGMNALSEPEWPRAFPYADTWLLALNEYYDRKYPRG